jgi:protein involved in polysaccharide export with SLBB domain
MTRTYTHRFFLVQSEFFKINRIILSIFLLNLLGWVLLFPLSAQEQRSGNTGATTNTNTNTKSDTSPIADSADARLMLALSTADYPATPGDVYTLAYYATGLGGAVTTPLTLDASYQLKVLNMGTLNARGKTYLQLRNEVINLVSRNYPMSGAAFTLTALGRFNVVITGETTAQGNYTVDGLTRIATLVTNRTNNASIRFIQITASNGTRRTYDIYKATTLGDLSQNPYIRPGDRIHVPAAGRIVSVNGEVFRPGRYELLEGESLQELVEYYGDGFTLDAAPDWINISRISTNQGVAGETMIFSYWENSDVELKDRDIVTISNKVITRPVLFLEGAISRPTTNVEQTTEEVEGTTIMEYPFYQGETLGSAIRAIRMQFTASADLENAYVIRGNQQIPKDLRKFLYQNDFSDDIPLENGDRVIIPFHQYFVLVAGAVKVPGRYPYVPDRPQDYYINLAGGRDELLNNGRGIEVFDMNNKKVSNTEKIAPESMIRVPTNTFTARFNQVGGIITTILSILSTALSIWAITR